jgi:glycosyltransferase involved in cell wall biosynthesis
MTVIEFNTLRAQLGLEQTVTLAGGADQNQVIRWWQSTTLDALPSDSEGMPLCLMVATACGLPIVATAVGGVRTWSSTAVWVSSYRLATRTRWRMPSSDC